MAYFRHSKYTHVIKLMMVLDSFPPILFYNTNCDSFTHVILKDSNMHCRYEIYVGIIISIALHGGLQSSLPSNKQ